MDDNTERPITHPANDEFMGLLEDETESMDSATAEAVESLEAEVYATVGEPVDEIIAHLAPDDLDPMTSSHDREIEGEDPYSYISEDDDVIGPEHLAVLRPNVVSPEIPSTAGRLPLKEVRFSQLMREEEMRNGEPLYVEINTTDPDGDEDGAATPTCSVVAVRGSQRYSEQSQAQEVIVGAQYDEIRVAPEPEPEKPKKTTPRKTTSTDDDLSGARKQMKKRSQAINRRSNNTKEFLKRVSYILGRSQQPTEESESDLPDLAETDIDSDADTESEPETATVNRARDLEDHRPISAVSYKKVVRSPKHFMGAQMEINQPIEDEIPNPRELLRITESNKKWVMIDEETGEEIPYTILYQRGLSGWLHRAKLKSHMSAFMLGAMGLLLMSTVVMLTAVLTNNIALGFAAALGYATALFSWVMAMVGPSNRVSRAMVVCGWSIKGTEDILIACINLLTQLTKLMLDIISLSLSNKMIIPILAYWTSYFNFVQPLSPEFHQKVPGILIWTALFYITIGALKSVPWILRNIKGKYIMIIIILAVITKAAQAAAPPDPSIIVGQANTRKTGQWYGKKPSYQFKPNEDKLVEKTHEFIENVENVNHYNPDEPSPEHPLFLGAICGKQPYILASIDKKHYCTKNDPNSARKIKDSKYTLLQRRTIFERVARHCHQTNRLWLVRCGVWAHSKIVHAPGVAEAVTFDLQDCKNDWQAGRHRAKTTSGEKTFPIHAGKVNRITYEKLALGTVNLLASNSESCTGQQYTTVDENGQTVTISDALVFTTVELVYYETTLQFNLDKPASPPVNKDTKTLLHDNCLISVDHCVNPEATYYWQMIQPECHLEKMATFSGEEFEKKNATHKIVLSREKPHQFLVLKGQKVKLNNCPLEVYMVSSILSNDLYLLEHIQERQATEMVQHLPSPSVRELHISLVQELRQSLTTFLLETQITQHHNHLMTEICLRELAIISTTEHQMILIREERKFMIYLMIRGDSVMIVRCPLVSVIAIPPDRSTSHISSDHDGQASVTNKPHCTVTLPVFDRGIGLGTIEKGKAWYLDQSTKIITAHPIYTLCANITPYFILDQRSNWYRWDGAQLRLATNKEKPKTTLNKYSFFEDDFDLLPDINTLRPDLLYNEDLLREWRIVSNLGAVHKSLNSQITTKYIEETIEKYGSLDEPETWDALKNTPFGLANYLPGGYIRYTISHLENGLHIITTIVTLVHILRWTCGIINILTSILQHGFKGAFALHRSRASYSLQYLWNDLLGRKRPEDYDSVKLIKELLDGQMAIVKAGLKHPYESIEDQKASAIARREQKLQRTQATQSPSAVFELEPMNPSTN